MTDLPDWTTQQQAGGIRYIGSVSVSVGGGGSGSGSLNVSLLPLDRSIIVVCPSTGALISTTISVLTNDPGVSPTLFSISAGISSKPQPVNAYVSAAITTAWQVAIDMIGPPAGPYVFYVFVDSSVTHVAVDPGATSIPVGITSPAFGQENALNSLPVVIASDQSAVSVKPAAVAGTIVQKGGALNLAPGGNTALGTIGPQGAQSLYEVTDIWLTAAVRGTSPAGGSLQVSLDVSDGTNLFWLAYVTVQPGAPVNLARHFDSPMDLVHYLDTTLTWTIRLSSSTALYGTTGNIDWEGQVLWAARQT